MKRILRHSSGVERIVKVGFSWTTLFFGWMPSALRGEVVSALKLFIFGYLTLGVYTAFKSFSINQEYEESLLLKGFEYVEDLEEGVPELWVIERIAVAFKIASPILIFFAYILVTVNILNFGAKLGTDLANRSIGYPSTFDTEYNSVNKNQQENKQELVVDSETKGINKQEPITEGLSAIYKDGLTVSQVTEKYAQIQKLFDEYDIKYGTMLREYQMPGYNIDEAGIEIMKTFYKEQDDILNMQWKLLKEILMEDTFKKLQQKQISWLDYRDNQAKIASESIQNEVEKEILYSGALGRETYKRNLEFYNEYFKF